jgi:hypothetical protein
MRIGQSMDNKVRNNDYLFTGDPTKIPVITVTYEVVDV